MAKSEATITIVISDLDQFQTFASELMEIAEEARLLWPVTGIAARIESAIERFAGGASDTSEQ